MSRIQPLQQDDIDQIQSTKQITTLNDVLTALLENSLDARATKINVSIDFARGSCTLEDNGCGILSDDFRDNGGLGRMYHSSRSSATSERYGRSGTFLASLAALALVAIHSRHHEEETSSSLILHRAKVISRHVPADSADDLASHGTRVVVRNLFGNIPVRLVQRSLASESSLKVEKQWLDLKARVVALLLACQKPFSIRIGEEGSGGRSLNLPAQSGGASVLTRRSLQQFAGKVTVPDLRDSLPVLYQSGFAPPESRAHWVPFSASTSNVSIKGVICLYPIPNKQCQFMSIGIHPCLSRNGHHELYEAVNLLFDRSDFGLRDEELEPVEDDFKGKGVAPARRRPRKGIDRWPMFVLHITLLNERFNRPELKDPSTAWLESTVKILSAAITQWLKVNHFRPQNQRRGRRADTQNKTRESTARASPQIMDSFASSKRRPNASKDNLEYGNVGVSCAPSYDSWSQIKGGNVFHPWDMTTKVIKDSQTSLSSSDPPSDDFDGISDADLLALDAVEDSTKLAVEHFNDDESIVRWRDTTTGRVHLLDARTGVVLPPSHVLTENSIIAASVNGHPEASQNLNLSLTRRQTQVAQNSEQQWLPGFLRQWDNPVFKNRQEPPIPLASVEGPGTEGVATSHSRCNHAEMSKHFLQTGITKSMKLSRSGLSNAKVINQVDGKFILCKAKSEESGRSQCLVLIDQHAASERVILEGLFAELCSAMDEDDHLYTSSLGHTSPVSYVLLDRPLHYTISSAEHDLFHRNAAHFASWGILYDLSQPPASSAFHPATERAASPSITVRTLPPGIAERSTIAPNLLIDILRSEIWSEHPPHTSSMTPYLSQRPQETNEGEEARDNPWIRRISTCPRGIIDMLNSRACRSAIMFNDKLSVAECEELLGQLAKCAFPFMCAHGRVSMVPLMEIMPGGEGLGTVPGFGQEERAGEESLKKAFGKWMKQRGA